MKTLVLGASGSTGTHLVNQLLEMGQQVKVIVRFSAKIPDSWKENMNVQIIEANVLDFSVNEMADLIKDCAAVASCLGHNLTLSGIYGEPRRLVTDSARLIYNAIKRNEYDTIVKFVLMNTTGYVNKDLNEPGSLTQRFVISIVRLLLPPHVDNEKAADFLWSDIGQKDKFIEWVSVRPYNLTNDNEVSEYEVAGSPSKPAVFDPRKTKRINVGNFMAELITKDDLWNKWKGQMPVILDIETK